MNQASNDFDRFQTAIQDHYVGVINHLTRRVGNRRDAEDLAQTVFEFVWRRIEQMPAEPDTLQWLYRIARRCLSNHWRTDERRGTLAVRILLRARMPSTSEWDNNADQSDVMTAFARLRPNQQEVLKLVAWDQLTHAEAAVVLGCTENAFAIRLHRVRSALQREFNAVRKSTSHNFERQSDTEES